MSYNMRGDCWHCGATLEQQDYGREASCPKCGKPTHVCRNCRFFAPAAPAQCREPVADPVSDKQRANFCGYFAAIEHSPAESTDADALRQAAEALFRV